MIHIGETIHAEAKKSGYSVEELVRKIGRSRSVLFNIYKRETIDTGLLMKFSQVLGVDFFQVYSEQLKTKECLPKEAQNRDR